MSSQSSSQSSATLPRLISDRLELRALLAELRQAGKSIGLVPTMGALHEGHLSLVDVAQGECDVVLVTIFVNPTQFGPDDDLAKYPRTIDADLVALGSRGVDVVFSPPADEMYCDGHSTSVVVGDVTDEYEGRCRPGHFPGVATIVLKLFNLVPADVAYFGQKDYQQSLVIRRMVADLDVPIEVRVCPTIREPDGLAMSSRNAYLSPEDRARAICVWQSLQQAASLIAAGERSVPAILTRMREVIRAAGVTHIDYVALADPQTLRPRIEIDRPVVALVAVHLGTTRLIDNILIDPPMKS